MTKVKVGEHRYINVSRRSLCDNCIADVCFRKNEMVNGRISTCSMFKSPFVAFKKCTSCGGIYELFSNFNALDFEKCPKCNESEELMAEEFGH